MESLVVNGSIQVLDEDIALASLSESRITLGPHDAAWTAFDESIVQFLQGLLAISSGVVVNIGIAKGATSNGITANTNGSNGTDLREELKEHSFSDGWVEFTNIK